MQYQRQEMIISKLKRELEDYKSRLGPFDDKVTIMEEIAAEKKIIEEELKTLSKKNKNINMAKTRGVYRF